MNNDINEKIVHAAPVPPFVRFVASSVPMVFDNSLSYYEALCALWKWLQDDVIDVINHNASVTEVWRQELTTFENDLTNKFNDLNDAFDQLHEYVDTYFDNLDVQEEINNKLDDMVEAGTLQEIITTYIQSNVAWTFDTVADMKLATNLVAGSYAQTLGFKSINDGGGALYKITDTGTANEMDVIAIDTLFAVKVHENTVTVEQFGAKGDGTTDDQDMINAAINSGASIIRFSEGKTYAVKGYETGQPQGSQASDLDAQTGIMVLSNTTLDLCNSTIQVITNDRTNYNVFTLRGVKNVIIKNGKIVGDIDDHDGATGEWGYGVAIRGGCDNITLDNLYCTKMWGDGINIAGYANGGTETLVNTNLYISNTISDDNRRQGMSLSNATDVYVENSKFINTGISSNTSPSAGVDIEAGYSTDTMKNIYFKKCEFSKNYGCGASLIDVVDGHTIDNVIFDGCLFDDNLGNHSSVGGIFVNKASHVGVINCIFQRNLSTRFVDTFYVGAGCYVKNNIFNNMTVAYNAANVDKGDFIISDNIFNMDADDAQYNYAVHALGYTGDNTGNTVYVKNNKFIRSLAKKDTVFAGWITFINNSGFTELVCDGNYFQFGNIHIICKLPAVIRNNTFVGSRDMSIQLPSSADYVHIDNNVFVQTSWYNNHAGIIGSESTNKIVLVNNTNYSRMLNTGLAFEPTRIPVRWYQNTPAASTDQNNVLVDNVSS